MNLFDIEETFDGVDLSYCIEDEARAEREKHIIQKALQFGDKDEVARWFQFKIPSIAMQQYSAVFNFFNDEENYWDLFLDHNDIKNELQVKIQDNVSLWAHTWKIELQIMQLLEPVVVSTSDFVNAMGNHLALGTTYFKCVHADVFARELEALVKFVIEFAWSKRSIKKAAKVLLDSDSELNSDSHDGRVLVQTCCDVYKVEKKYVYLLLNILTTWNVLDKARTLSDHWMAANPTYSVNSRRKRELSELMFNCTF